mmetsp:Transcript_3770/g.7610  ORF Transcript_3770/g.7610 Transcript_3770/m.7610 type:complete len:270 (+) Transcript_3770:148-957(+)
MGTACARPEPPSPAEAAVAPGVDKALGPLGGFRLFEIELEGGWVPFEPRISKMLAEADVSGQHRVEYQARRQTYIVDFDTMEQINKLSGKRRRIRRVGAVGASLAPNQLGQHAAAMETMSGLPSHGSLAAPPVPTAFPELMQVSESELGRFKGSRTALDAFILTLPQARVLVDRSKEVRDENSRLQKSSIASLASTSQQADGEAEALLQQALDTPGVMDVASLTSFKERYLQQKLEKQMDLVVKKRLECNDAEWHALSLTPATTRGGLS